jgi:hypothetical protein
MPISAYAEQPKRSYVAINAFNDDFFTYTKTTVLGVTTGSLAVVTGDAAQCPAGRVLRENGKKLFPGAPGITTLLIGVIDSVTFLSGFINPDSPVFTPMNTDKPAYLADSTDVTDGTFGDLPNEGPGVYTLGDSHFGRNVDVTGTLDVSGATTLGGKGSPFDFIRFGTIACNPGNITSGAIVGTTVTITVGGVTPRIGDMFIFETPAALNSGLQYTGFLTQTGGVTIYLRNNTGGAIDDSSRDWRYVWIRNTNP